MLLEEPNQSPSRSSWTSATLEPTSAAVTLTVTGPPEVSTREPLAGELTDAVGAVPSTFTTCVRTDSGLPPRSHVRNFTVLVCVRVNGAVYSGELGIGSVPSSVYRVAPSPPPESVRAKLIDTGDLKLLVPHTPPLQAIVVVGGGNCGPSASA